MISFRVAHGGAQGKYGGDPDLTAFGKIMGGGLPVGAVGGRRAVMELLDPTSGAPRVISGGTFSANPLTMAAGQAAMEQMTPEVYARLDALGERLRREGTAIFARAGVPGQLTGDGSLFRIMLSEPRSPTIGPPSKARHRPGANMARLHRALLDAGGRRLHQRARLPLHADGRCRGGRLHAGAGAGRRPGGAGRLDMTLDETVRPPAGADLAGAILEAIDPEALAHDCLDFVAVRSETGDEAAGSAFFADLLRRAGWEPSSTRPRPGRPNVAARIAGTGPPVAGGRRLPVMNGHVDTIPIGRSWPPRRDGDWIYGRGTEDMKGGPGGDGHAQAVQGVLRPRRHRLQGRPLADRASSATRRRWAQRGPLRLIERLARGPSRRRHPDL